MTVKIIVQKTWLFVVTRQPIDGVIPKKPRFFYADKGEMK